MIISLLTGHKYRGTNNTWRLDGKTHRRRIPPTKVSVQFEKRHKSG